MRLSWKEQDTDLAGKEKKPQNRGHQTNITHLLTNYNTLTKKYGSKVLKMERYLEKKYPIAYGKAPDERKIRILNDFLEQDSILEDDDYAQDKDFNN